eukprot:8192086-Heterocapsa_arctica.AAC.1
MFAKHTLGTGLCKWSPNRVPGGGPTGSHQLLAPHGALGPGPRPEEGGKRGPFSVLIWSAALLPEL